MSDRDNRQTASRLDVFYRNPNRSNPWAAVGVWCGVAFILTNWAGSIPYQQWGLFFFGLPFVAFFVPYAASVTWQVHRTLEIREGVLRIRRSWFRTTESPFR